MQRKFYDAVRNLEVEDVSGLWSTQDIEAQFGAGDFQMVEYDLKTHVVKDINGVLTSVSREDEAEQPKNKERAILAELKSIDLESISALRSEDKVKLAELDARAEDLKSQLGDTKETIK